MQLTLIFKTNFSNFSHHEQAIRVLGEIEDNFLIIVSGN